MNERLLQYIWQFQYYNPTDLHTTEQQPLQVLHVGSYNTNQGPDFLNAKIKIGNTIWAGNIELHVNASEWKTHDHSNDKNYNNVILHVVMNNDTDLQLPFHTLELKQRISKLLLSKYKELMNNQRYIPCENQFQRTDTLTMASCKERMLVERLQKKTLYIYFLLQQNNYHWEEIFWWMLARNFGTKINSSAFEKIAQSIPVNILAKHKNQLQQIEALLLGQAGFLDKPFREDYPKMLQKEYHFLKKKYGLKTIDAPLYFLRMRPANFPTVRLAQLSALITSSEHLFSKIKEIQHCSEVKKLLAVIANDYWHYHYLPDEATSYKKKPLGEEMIRNILINSIIPMIFAYGHFHKNDMLKNKAVTWLQQLPAENNSITRKFISLGMKIKTAFDSQASIQLKNEYCDNKRCLQCAIGNKILKETN